MLFPRINWLKLYSFMLSLFSYHFYLLPLSGSSMMNTLHKSLIIATLIISTFISGVNVDLFGPQNTAADQEASRRFIVSSPYLNFGRVAAEDGLSQPIIVGELFMKTGTGYFGSARESSDLADKFFLFEKLRRQR